jgi:hypothetical protein
MVKVILSEPFSDFCRTTTDYWVIASVVIWRTTKDTCANDAFAQQVILVSKAVFHNVAEKEMALLARPKDRAVEDFVEGMLDEFLLDLRRWIFFVHFKHPQFRHYSSDDLSFQ